MEKWEKIGLRMMASVGVVLLLFLVCYSWRYTMRLYYRESIADGRDNPALHMLFLVSVSIIVMLISKLTQILSEKIIHVIAVVCAVLAAGAGCILAYCADIYVVADQAEIFTAAEAFFTGDAAWLADYEYFKVYPFQLGIVELYAALFQMAGKVSYLVLEYAQAVAAGVTVYAGFRITRELFHDKRAELFYLVCVLSFLPLYLYCIYIYGESFGVSLIMLSIWFFCRANREQNTGKEIILYFILAAFSFALACMARKAFLLVWIAMLVIQTLICMRRKKVLHLTGVLVMLLIMAVWEKSFLGIAGKQTGKEFGEACPAILWVAMGLMDAPEGEMVGPGNYNGYNRVTFVKCNYDKEAASDIAVAYIADRMREWTDNPGDMVRFMKEKALTQWNEPTYGAFIFTSYMNAPKAWVKDIYQEEEMNARFRGYLDSYQAVVYLAMLGYFILILRGKLDERQALPGVILLGGFCMTMLWEAKSRYVYPYMVMILPCVAGSMIYYVTALGALFGKCSKYVKGRLQNK